MMDFIVTNKGILPYAEMDNLPFISDASVYEVIRIIDGVALFLEDHFIRLMASVQTRGLQYEMSFSEFRQYIAELVRLNQTKNGNVKFVLSAKSNECNWVFTFIAHSYPSPEDYISGVSTNFHFVERENPNEKIIQNIVRNSANQLIADQKLYEVLLVDRNGVITEGSRSNVFFVKNNVFFTAPASRVLIGITRQKVIECLAELGFPLVELAVSVTDIGSYDAAFLTGTSPKVLPIRLIGQYEFDTHLRAVNELMDRYNHMVTKYIETH